MSFTYEPGTDIGNARLLIPDRESSTPIFSDDEIQAFLDMEGGSVRRGVALALDTIGTDEALVQKVIRVNGLMTNGAETMRALAERSKALRAQALDSEIRSGSVFDYAEQVNNEFGAMERVVKQQQRQGWW